VIFQELSDDYNCLQVLFKDVATEGRKAGYIEAAQQYDSFLELLIQKTEQVKNTLKKSQTDLDALFTEIYEEKEALSQQRAIKIEVFLRKFDGRIKREELMKQLEFDPKCPFKGMSFSESCLPFLLFGLIGAVYSIKLAKMKKSEIAGWQDARKIWKKKIDAEIINLTNLINSGNTEIQEMINCIFALINYKIQNAELDFMVRE
jgi:hypothetical protein